MIPLSFKTYFLNLTKTNLENKPTWELLHDFQTEYSLTDLSPDTLYNAFAKELLSKEEVALKYLWNKDKRSPMRQPRNGCDDNCRRDMFCDIVNFEYSG